MEEWKMAAIDLKKELKDFYSPSAKAVSLVDVPAMNFIMIDGQGAPAGPQFQQAIEALYSIAYTIKFAKKKREGVDYPVMALEGLWWADNMQDFDPNTGDRNRWQWTLLVMQPSAVSRIDFESGREAAVKKKPNLPIKMVRLDKFQEGPSAQIMHVGPFTEEGPNVQRLHQKIAEIGGQPSGKHHEIYLSDFRKVEPAKMKTVLRQPYRKWT
jgi:hypothetical protein